MAIGCSSIPKLLHAKEEREKVSGEIHEQLNCQKYAVRSSALIEDSSSESFAGQFHTEIDVDPGGLSEAIYKVLIQADQKKVISQFSLIIQEFIEPDFAGVTFTRNPLGGREMVIESHAGRGEELVSGKITPQRVAFYHHEKKSSFTPLSEVQIEMFKAIESAFSFPQDVEWCVRKGKFYLLQTRPITTISTGQFKEIKSLEELLPQTEAYFFEKTELAEIAPRPKSFMLSLLQKIYDQGGPVAQVYKKKGIEYQDTHFLKIIGNELYVDKQKELQSLLPIYSTLKNDFSPHFHSFRGLGRTLKNIFSLARLKGDKIKLFEGLKTALTAKVQDLNLAETVASFLKAYQLIFEVNLYSGTAIKKLEQVLKRENLTVLETLTFPLTSFLSEEDNQEINFPAQNLQGNSLNIEDETRFSKIERPLSKANMHPWEALPNWKKSYLKPYISEALFWQRMREIGRWLTVKKINELRNIIFGMAKKQGFKDAKDVYFFSVEELDGVLDHDLLKKRKREHHLYSKFTFPERITDRFYASKMSASGISPGIGGGTLVDLQSLSRVKGKKILYTEVLSPELTQYFDEIEGILSKTGGLLSHLAIIAREKGLPVITNVSLATEKLKMGDRIEMNANDGGVKIISNSD